jgi:DNA-binding response OmpR family regulator
LAVFVPAAHRDRIMNAMKTILFVENDPVALEMYRNRLQREGFRVESASDGLDALRVLSRLVPDLVVLDAMLTKLSGAEVLTFMRADPRLRALPVIVFSNEPITGPDEVVPDAGSVRHLLKSDCTFPILLQTIHDLLAAAPAVGPIPGPASENLTIKLPVASTQTHTSALSTDESAGAQTGFISQALAEIPKIREHCFAYIKSPASPASLQHLPQLHQRVQTLNSNAGETGCARIALLTNAFATLLSEIIVKPSWVTPSVLQTIAQAVDCLGYLLKSSEADLAEPMPQAKVLAVDDDAVCNHVIVNTLKRANFDACSIDNPMAAMESLEATHYDVILLDVNMPGLTGFELCEKLRRLPHCKTTPVIFITGHNNFDNRKQSVLSGGHDFITKPVSPSELALKVTIHLLKARSRSAAVLPLAPAPDAAEAFPETAERGISIQIKPPSSSERENVLPAELLQPTTQSSNSTADTTAAPAEALPLAEPFPADVLTEALQPVAAAPRHESQTGDTREFIPVSTLPTVEDSNTGGPAVASSMDETMPALGLASPPVAKAAPQTTTPVNPAQPEFGQAGSPKPSDASASETESGKNGIEPGPLPLTQGPAPQTGPPSVFDEMPPTATTIPALQLGTDDPGTLDPAEFLQPGTDGGIGSIEIPTPLAAVRTTADVSAAPISDITTQPTAPAPNQPTAGTEAAGEPSWTEPTPIDATESPSSAGSGPIFSSTETAGMDTSPSPESPGAPPTSPPEAMPSASKADSDNRRQNNIMNSEQNTPFDKIVLEVAKIIFGDNNLTDLNLRLVRMALERHNIHEMLNRPAGS